MVCTVVSFWPMVRLYGYLRRGRSQAWCHLLQEGERDDRQAGGGHRVCSRRRRKAWGRGAVRRWGRGRVMRYRGMARLWLEQVRKWRSLRWVLVFNCTFLSSEKFYLFVQLICTCDQNWMWSKYTVNFLRLSIQEGVFVYVKLDIAFQPIIFHSNGQNSQVKFFCPGIKLFLVLALSVFSYCQFILNWQVNVKSDA